jgi:hypothetical protein
MTRAISVLLGLGLLAATGVAAGFPRSIQQQAVVQESLARRRDAGLDFHCSEMTISER